MPYIKPEMREKLEPAIEGLIAVLKAETTTETRDGALNYTLCRLFTELYEERYFDFNRMMGTLSCVQAELYRRRAAPYENRKAEENGDLPGW